MADLKGKTIYTAGQGANPEYVLRYLLTKNGIDPDRDVTIVFVADNDELTAAVVTGTAPIALVPEPKVTACIAQMTAAGKTPPTIALSMNEEWNRIAGDDGGLMMGCVIARRSYVEKHPDQIAAFLTEYERSVTAVKADPAAAASLCEQYGVIPKAAIAKAAIPRCALTFVTGNAMKEGLGGYLRVLYDYAPATVGGALPKEDFYYDGNR